MEDIAPADKPGILIRYPTVSSSMTVPRMPLRQQPRELFEQLGPENVPDAVLLAILLRSGTQGLNVVDLANALLTQFGTLTDLARASVDELSALRGMGRVKAQVLKASLELAKRLADEKTPEAVSVRTPEDAANLLRERVRLREEESFWIILLDSKNRLKRAPMEITRGILDASLVHPREVFKEAIRSTCAALVMAHNHPSGDPTPSAEDIRITRKIVEAGKIVEIAVMDHIILGTRGDRSACDFFSMRESGLVEF